MTTSVFSLGVLSIATNIYIDYWEAMVVSFDKELNNDQKCTAHVFTDQVEKAKVVSSKLTNISVEIYEIPPYGWPDATIRRYEVFSAFSESITEDFLIHMDADMVILTDIFSDFSRISEEVDITLIAHPGFWNKRESILEKFKAILKGIKIVKGSWETRPESQAFVDTKFQRTYVCGGIWGGKRDAFFELTNKLAKAVETDRGNSIMAIWHDESHLNKWASENNYLLLTPEYCFVQEYGHLKGLEPKVLAVTKEKRTR